MNQQYTLDPILVEVVSSALSSIVDEMGETLVRSAFSSNIKERRDCTSALFDCDGALIAQTEQASPVHLGSLTGAITSIRDRHSLDEIAQGDVFVVNDPYSGGGSQLPDMTVASPIFADGQLAAWAANLAHHADFGDRGHAHIFQEGLRIPPVKIMRAGLLDENVFALILANC